MSLLLSEIVRIILISSLWLVQRHIMWNDQYLKNSKGYIGLLFRISFTVWAIMETWQGAAAWNFILELHQLPESNLNIQFIKKIAQCSFFSILVYQYIPLMLTHKLVKKQNSKSLTNTAKAAIKKHPKATI